MDKVEWRNADPSEPQSNDANLRAFERDERRRVTAAAFAATRRFAPLVAAMVLAGATVPGAWGARGPVPPAFGPPAALGGVFDRAASLEPVSRSWIVRLAQPSLLESGGTSRSKSALLTEWESLGAIQAPAETLVTATGARVVFRYRAIRNGFLVHANTAQVEKLRALPDVVEIVPAPLVRLTLGDAVPFVGAAEVWRDPGFSGRGTTIAVIDTGLDYTHAAFGGPGSPEAYASNDDARIEPGTFPTEKVVGGHDLAGTWYTADPRCEAPLPPSWQCSPVPEPDSDPLDRHGHGTHVASIAAGHGVGAEIGGGWRLHPGVAPRAKIVALKVFGSPRGAEVVTDLADAAIEWVVSSNLGLPVPGTGGVERIGKIDVINLSLGAGWGGGITEAERVIAAATAAGVTVVASAGNAGNIPMIVGSPGSAASALSVASTMPPGEPSLTVKAEWVADGNVHSRVDRAVDNNVSGMPRAFPAGFAGELAWLGTGCPDEGLDAAAGKIALIEPGNCQIPDALRRLEGGAATAVIMIHPSLPPAEMSGAGSFTIPGISLPAAGGGDALRNLLLDGRRVDVRVESQPLDLVAGTISSFSSRGPSRYAAPLKPQLSAPGSNIHAARLATGIGGTTLSGTSMASPIVAGAVALLWERVHVQKLNLEPLDIAALLMNYARPDVANWRNDDPDRYGVPIARQGAGSLDVAAAARGTTLVRTAGIAELGFGLVYASRAAVVQTRSVTVTNLAAEPRTYDLRFRPRPGAGAHDAVDLRVGPASLTVPAGASATAIVTLTVAPGAPALQTGPIQAVRSEAAWRAVEADGWLEVGFARLDGEVETVVVPYYALPQPASCVESLGIDEAGVTLELDNQCTEPGRLRTYPEMGSDRAEPAIPGELDIVSVGARLVPAASTRIHSCNSLLEFNIATRSPRRIPAGVEFRVLLDTTADGEFDSVAFNYHGSDVHRGAADGLWLVGLAPLDPDPITGDLRLAPDLERLAGTGWPQAFTIDESVARLQICADTLPGEGSEPFDFAVRAVDIGSDYPQSAGFPGYDDAPDGLSAGQRFRYDPVAARCLRVTAGEPGALDLDAFVEVPRSSGVALQRSSLQGCPELPDSPAAIVAESNSPESRSLWRLGPQPEEGIRIYLPATAAGAVP
jgi:minor extracellular serine protease Vpr